MRSSTLALFVFFFLFFFLAAIPIIKGSGDEEEIPLQNDKHPSPEHRLFSHLFQEYNKHIRPIARNGETTKVFFEVSLLDILKLDTKEQMIKTNTEIIMRWKDDYLTWNPSDFNDTKIIRVPYEDIWFPDIILMNTADADYFGSILNTNAIIAYDGEVELLSHGILNSICNVDVQYYPFDQQVCEMRFSSWTYDKEQIMLIRGPSVLSYYSENPEFFLEDFWSTYSEDYNPCCEQKMSTISYFLQLQRRTIFSLFFFIMPGILINICALMVFSLPSESGEKIGLGTNSMLAMMVFLMAMTEKLPPTQKLPLAGVYYGACITIISLNITLSVSVLNLNVMGMRGYQVPELLKKLTIFVAKLIVVRIPLIVRVSWELEEELDDVQPVKETKVEPMDKSKDSEGNLVKVFTVEPHNPPPTPLPPSKLPGKTDELDTFKDPFQKNILVLLESINSILLREEKTASKTKRKSNLVEEWKFVSRVMDRSLFIIFTIVCIIFNIVILTSSPYGEYFSYCPIGDGLCEDMTYEEILKLTALHDPMAVGGFSY